MSRTISTLLAVLMTVCSTASSDDLDLSGTYTITSEFNTLAFDVPGGRREEGLNIIQWGCHGSDGQRWLVVAVDSQRGWYRIISAHTGLALDIRGGSREDRAVLIQSRVLNSSSQHWRIEHVRGNFFRIVSRWSGKAIDIPFGSQAQGTPLELYEVNNQTNQGWKFTRIHQ